MKTFSKAISTVILQHIATHYNTLQLTATHCITLQHKLSKAISTDILYDTLSGEPTFENVYLSHGVTASQSRDFSHAVRV